MGLMDLAKRKRDELEAGRPAGAPLSPVTGLGNPQTSQPPQAAPAPTPAPFDANAFGGDWAKLTQGRSGTNQDFDQLFPELEKLYPGLTRGGSKNDKVTLPGGQWFDAVKASGLGGQGYNPFNPMAQGQEPGGGSAGQVFDDPATREWEQLLRTLNQRLQQPQPTYSPQQRELMQTYAQEPLEQQRQAQRQQTVERFAARGINPGSGILEQALQDIDRSFNEMRTNQQSGFALNQIGREDQLFNQNEQRALAGLNLFGQIPQLADSRMMMANQTLIPSNPYQMVQLQQQANQLGFQNQQWNDAQTQQFWQWLGALAAGL